MPKKNKYDYKPVEYIETKPVPHIEPFEYPESSMYRRIKILVFEYAHKKHGAFPKYVTMHYEDWYLLMRDCFFPNNPPGRFYIHGTIILRSKDVEPGDLIFSEETL